jgi:hypothetical protein
LGHFARIKSPKAEQAARAAGSFFCAQLLQLNRVGESCVGINRAGVSVADRNWKF